MRNRAAHQEPLLQVNLQARLTDIIDLAGMINSGLATYIRASSTIPDVAAARGDLTAPTRIPWANNRSSQ